MRLWYDSSGRMDRRPRGQFVGISRAEESGGGIRVAALSLHLLGPFEAEIEGIPLTRFRTKSVQALLIYLACQPDQAHRREGLIALLWPGLPQKSAQANLRQNLYLLRKAIPNVAAADGGDDVPYLVADRQTIQVNPEAAFEVDVLTFNQLLKEGIDRYTEAVALFRGDFLCDFMTCSLDTPIHNCEI